jgi:hypothetical protein
MATKKKPIDPPIEENAEVEPLTRARANSKVDTHVKLLVTGFTSLQIYLAYCSDSARKATLKALREFATSLNAFLDANKS